MRKYGMATEYRPCPSFPGYRASLCGIIIRDEWSSITKTGKTRVNPARVLPRIKKHYVLLGDGKWVRGNTMVADAWEGPVIHSGDRPAPTYRSGRVVTVREYFEMVERRLAA